MLCARLPRLTDGVVHRFALGDVAAPADGLSGCLIGCFEVLR
jgi:hypothetical protein